MKNTRFACLILIKKNGIRCECLWMALEVDAVTFEFTTGKLDFNRIPCHWLDCGIFSYILINYYKASKTTIWALIADFNVVSKS